MTNNFSSSLVSQAKFSANTFNRKFFIALRAGVLVFKNQKAISGSLDLVERLEKCGLDFSSITSEALVNYLHEMTSKNKELIEFGEMVTQEAFLAHKATFACKEMFDFLDDNYFDQPAKDIFIAQDCIRNPVIISKCLEKAVLPALNSKSKKRH